MSTTDGAHGTKRPAWVFWLLGLGGVIAVVGAAVKSDAVAFAQIVHHARPWWLAIACVLQLATYVVQGEVWRVMGRRADTRIPLGSAAELSLVHLFVDQALPSGGLSGAVMIAQALQQRGMTEAAAIATVVVDTVSYYLAFLIALAAAVALASSTAALATSSRSRETIDQTSEGPQRAAGRPDDLYQHPRHRRRKA